jgi:NAD(P)-dependent dehydrogenase (short-subunit alcohol dehydrogenase family)
MDGNPALAGGATALRSAACAWTFPELVRAAGGVAASLAREVARDGVRVNCVSPTPEGSSPTSGPRSPRGGSRTASSSSTPSPEPPRGKFKKAELRERFGG